MLLPTNDHNNFHGYNYYHHTKDYYDDHAKDYHHDHTKDNNPAYHHAKDYDAKDYYNYQYYDANDYYNNYRVHNDDR
jgi:hypothetical protein